MSDNRGINLKSNFLKPKVSDFSDGGGGGCLGTIPQQPFLNNSMIRIGLSFNFHRNLFLVVMGCAWCHHEKKEKKGINEEEARMVESKDLTPYILRLLYASKMLVTTYAWMLCSQVTLLIIDNHYHYHYCLHNKRVIKQCYGLLV